MRRCLFTAIILAHLAGIASVSFAEPSIPDRCFVDGELDCERPECHDICFTPPTPGFERMPFAPPPSGLRTADDEEAERILAGPRLQPPFKEDTAPTTQTPLPKKADPAPITLVPCPKELDDDMLDTLKKKAFFKQWIKVSQERIEDHIFDPKSNYETLQNSQELYDQYTYRQLTQACYPQEGKCAKGPTKEINKMLYDLFTTIISLRTERDRYYVSVKSCIDHPKCENPFNHYDLECVNSQCQSDFMMSHSRDRIKKYENKMAEQVAAIKALQCGLK